MTSPLIGLVLAVLAIVIAGASWRRRAGRPMSRRAQLILLAGLFVVAAVLVYFLYAWTPAR